METAFIGLGSNLDNPVQHVRKAISDLNQSQVISVRKVSSLYRSAPMGPENQPDYINAVAEIATSLDENELLIVLQSIEAAHGRVRTDVKWGPRTLDLDLLLYGDKLINNDTINIPHPGLYERAFVLYPLQEIVPNDFRIPGQGALVELLKKCDRGDLEIIAEDPTNQKRQEK